MGVFFTNLHLRATATEPVVAALRLAGALPAYVTEPGGGWVSLYPEATENQDEALLEGMARLLSTAIAAFMSLLHARS